MIKMSDETMMKILDLLSREGPLSPNQIANKLDMNPNTIRPTLSLMRRLGSLVRHFREIPGVYEITEEGKKYLEERRRP